MAKEVDQATLNYDDEIYDPLFPVGYGLTKDDITIDQLGEYQPSEAISMLLYLMDGHVMHSK